MSGDPYRGRLSSEELIDYLGNTLGVLHAAEHAWAQTDLHHGHYDKMFFAVQQVRDDLLAIAMETRRAETGTH